MEDEEFIPTILCQQTGFFLTSRAIFAGLVSVSISRHEIWSKNFTKDKSRATTIGTITLDERNFASHV